MEVSQQEVIDTSIVLGNKDIHKYTISQNSNFLRILSKSLYSDVYLATVREVICNAWDSHIASGIEDTPVEVTLNKKFLTIRDFGKGIDPDKIHNIYCGYGITTKEEQCDQTGGFGLGSKAPFAYTENFSVTNCYNGTKKVYNASFGSEESDGFPYFAEMVSVPTEETGLTVTIPINNPDDCNHFYDKIIAVIAQSGIKTKFTFEGIEQQINYLEVGKEKGSFVFIPASKTFYRLQRSTPFNTFVKYGSILYPIPYDENLDYLISIISTTLRSRISGTCYLVLQAEPDSLSITPSRESLNLTNTTKQELTNLLNSFIKKVNRSLIKSDKLFTDFITKNFNEISSMDFHYLKQVQSIFRQLNIGNTYKDIHNEDQLAELLFEKKSTTNDPTYCDKLLKCLIKNKHPYSKNLSILLKKKDKGFDEITKNTLKHLVVEGGINKNYLKVGRIFYYRNTSFNEAIFKNINCISNTISVLYSFKDVSLTGNSIIYKPPKNLKKQEEDISWLKANNYIVEDYRNVNEEEEIVPEKQIPIIKEKPKKREGLPSILGNLSQHGIYLDRNHLDASHRSDYPYIKNPPIVCKPHKLSGESFEIKTIPYGNYLMPEIVKLYGHMIGVVRSSAQLQSYLNKGCVELNAFLEAEMMNNLFNNKNLERFILHTKTSSVEDNKVFYIIYKYNNVFINTRKHLGITNILDQKTYILYLLYQEYCEKYRYVPNEDFDKLKEYITSIPTKSIFAEKINKVKKECKSLNTIYRIFDNMSFSSLSDAQKVLFDNFILSLLTIKD